MRIARIIMFAVAAVLLLYIVAGNIALKAGLFQHIANTNPDALLVSWDRAWTILPGRVHLRNFKLRYQDNNIQQLLTIETATLQVKLFDMMRKRFHATSVEATGTRYRFRHKVVLAAVEHNRARLAAYPPIEGYPDPAIKHAPGPDSEPDDLWKVQLDNVEASVDELWFLEYRYVGRGRVSGGFRLLPNERVMVFPTELALDSAPLTAGETWPVMDGFRGRVHVKVDDFDVNLDVGSDVFTHISTSGWFRGEIPGLGFTDIYLGPDMLLTRGGGPVEAVWGMDHGRFLLGTRIAYRTERARLETRPFEFRAGLRAEVAVVPGLRGRVLAVGLDSPRLEIDGTGKRSGVRAAVVTGAELWLAMTPADVTEPWDVDRARFAVDSMSVPDLRLMNPVTAAAHIVAKKGSLTGKARADVDDEGHLNGGIEAELAGAEVAVEDRLTVAASGTFKGRIVQPKAGRARGRVEGVELVLSRLTVTSRGASTGPGWLRLDEGTIEYDRGSPNGIRGKVGVFMPKADPFLAALGIDLGSLPKLAKGLVNTDNLRATIKVSHDPAVTDVEVLTAKVDGAAAQGRFRRREEESFGAFLVRTKLLGVGLKILNGETNVKMFAGRGWLAEQLAALGFERGS